MTDDEDQTNDSESSVLVSNQECWDKNELKYFSEEYLWLLYNAKKLGCTIYKKTNLGTRINQGHITKELVNGEVYAIGSDTNKMQENFTFTLK